MISRNLPVFSRNHMPCWENTGYFEKNVFFSSKSCAFPVCILHRQKLALPELGLNKAEGRSKRPCDAISTRQPAQSTCRQKWSDRAELTPLRRGRVGHRPWKGRAQYYVSLSTQWGTQVSCTPSDGEKRNRADARFGKNRGVSPKLKHAHMSRPHGLMHLCRFSCM